jgi:CPA1 family monovalent cation:H+ antiporter
MEHPPDALLPGELFVLLIAIATGVALLARRSALPYSVALVLAGLGMAILVPGTLSVEVTPDLILAVMLPGLVFEAAYKLDLTELRRTSAIVAVLAAPGVVITAGVVAVVVSVTTGLDPTLAFLLGAIISATDPVAVVSLFRRLGAPSRLATAVEAESLFNDGTGVVLFGIALTAVTQPVSIADGALSFVVIVLASGVIGLLAGAAAYALMRLTDDRLLVVAISVVAAYGTYLVADRLHESGIFATVMVGLVLGNLRHPFPLSEVARDALDTVWEFLAFLLTGLSFLLIGLAMSVDLLVTAVPVIVAGFVAITAARAAVVYGLIGVGERVLPGPSLLPLGYLHVMFWSGLRGAIAVALALALPLDLPQRDLLAGAVFGIVLVTLVVQGTTASWVVRRAGVPLDGSGESGPVAGG